MTIDNLIDIAAELSVNEVLIKEGLEIVYKISIVELEKMDKELYLKNNGTMDGWEKSETLRLPIFGINFVLKIKS